MYRHDEPATRVAPTRRPSTSTRADRRGEPAQHLVDVVARGLPARDEADLVRLDAVTEHTGGVEGVGTAVGQVDEEHVDIGWVDGPHAMRGQRGDARGEALHHGVAVRG